MSSLTVTDEHISATKAKVIQPAWVRVMHWTNAFAMILMILSGWQIYNASPLFNFSFPRDYTLGGWLGGGLLWHFAAMWLLMINGLAYLVTGFATGHAICGRGDNGAPDCRVASDQLCQAKGYKTGRGVDIESAENCNPRVYLPGYQKKDGDCRTDNYVTRATCN